MRSYPVTAWISVFNFGSYCLEDWFYVRPTRKRSPYCKISETDKALTPWLLIISGASFTSFFRRLKPGYLVRIWCYTYLARHLFALLDYRLSLGSFAARFQVVFHYFDRWRVWYTHFKGPEGAVTPNGSRSENFLWYFRLILHFFCSYFFPLSLILSLGVNRSLGFVYIGVKAEVTLLPDEFIEISI